MFLLKPLVPFYYFLYKTHLFLYRFGFLKTFSSPNQYVIGVGNLTVGGAGKTPFVSLLSSVLSKNKIEHCIISGGYKKLLSGEQYINKKNINKFSAQEIGDEPYMLFKELGAPLFVGNKKKCLSLAATKKKFTHIIIDDSFQSHYIKTNYNVLLIDCSLSLSKYKLLPDGLLREPLSAMQRAGLIVFTKTNFCSPDNLKEKLNFFSKYMDKSQQKTLISSLSVGVLVGSGGALVPSNQKEIDSIDFVGFCGIANPGSFKKTLDKTKINCVKNFVFPDHFHYTKKQMCAMLEFADKKNISSLITTKKDYYKIYDLVPERFSVFVLDVAHVFKEKIQWKNFLI